MSSPCIEWARARHSAGYGVFRRNGKTIYAHRDAWEKVHGPIPVGMEVMHICDNPACVNIEHMRLGTHAENMADMRAKGRHRWGRRPRGTEVNTNKLTPEQVLAIRADSRSGPQIARDYGVSKTLVNLIKKRKTWRHL